MFKEDNIQEVVFLDTLEKQDYIFDWFHEELSVTGYHENKFEDWFVEKKDDVPFSLAGNNIELLDQPRYDEYDDDLLKQPILYASSESDPLYDDYTSQ